MNTTATIEKYTNYDFWGWNPCNAYYQFKH